MLGHGALGRRPSGPFTGSAALTRLNPESVEGKWRVVEPEAPTAPPPKWERMGAAHHVTQARRVSSGSRTGNDQIAVAQAAFDTTSASGSVKYEAGTYDRREVHVWLEPAVANRLRDMRGQRESYTDVILRLASAS
jgi:hypothetical protein